MRRICTLWLVERKKKETDECDQLDHTAALHFSCSLQTRSPLKVLFAMHFIARGLENVVSVPEL